jgi:poly-beta-1,6-N-acetyl-D-glucosamine synthase
MLVAEIIFWASLALVAYAYVGYPIFLVACHFFVRRHASRTDESLRPTISLIMAAYNEVAHIRQKLENCLALDYPPGKLEILIGSDGSNDGTNQIVEEFADRGVKLFAFTDRRGKMAAINRVVKQATGEICVFSDVSERFDADAMTKLVRHFADPSVGLVAGNHIFDKKKTGLGIGTAVYRNFKRFLWRIESRVYSSCRCDGPIYACRRELFPFPPDGTINDDMAVPLGVLSQNKRLVFEPEAVVRGESHGKTGQFFRQKIRCMAGRYQLLAWCPNMFRPWPIRRWWIFLSHNVIPLFVPWFMLFALVANAVLWFSGNELYQALLIAQGCFYFVAAAGYVAEQRGFHWPPAAVPFYFVAANVGSLFGFFAFAFGKQRATWRRLD